MIYKGDAKIEAYDEEAVAPTPVAALGEVIEINGKHYKRID